MKHAYVSMVLPMATLPDSHMLERVDAALASETQAHEIVVVTPWNSSPAPQLFVATQGPVTFVTTHIRSTTDGAILAGLARSVGDFVVEWRGPIGAIAPDLILSLLGPTDSGAELVEVQGTAPSTASRLFAGAVNGLRPRSAPLRKTVGRAYSRRALQMVMESAKIEPQLDVIVAELPMDRSLLSMPYPIPRNRSLAQRVSDGFALLSKGTRFGSAVPLTLAAISAALGIAAALYAIAVLVFRGQPPEGWTTLMVVVGLGQAAILTMLGLVWARLDALVRGPSRNADATAAVHVMAPSAALMPMAPIVSE